MDFQPVARPYLFRANWRKISNFATKVWYLASHSVCDPARIQEFYIQTWASWISATEKMWWLLVCHFLWMSGPSLKAHSQDKLLLKNDLLANVFKECMTVSTQNAGKLCYFKEEEASTESVFSSLCLAGTVLLGRCESCSFTQRT